MTPDPNAPQVGDVFLLDYNGSGEEIALYVLKVHRRTICDGVSYTRKRMEWWTWNDYNLACHNWQPHPEADRLWAEYVAKKLLCEQA